MLPSCLLRYRQTPTEREPLYPQRLATNPLGDRLYSKRLTKKSPFPHSFLVPALTTSSVRLRGKNHFPFPKLLSLPSPPNQQPISFDTSPKLFSSCCRKLLLSSSRLKPVVRLVGVSTH